MQNICLFFKKERKKMGSLVGGWDSAAVKYKRNSSLTKEEIDAYWKTNKKEGEDHLSPLSPSTKKVTSEESKKTFERSSSLPMTNNSTEENLKDMEEVTKLEKLVQNGWWTKSNWAFLNEPPVIAPPYGPSNRKYTPQFHVPSFEASSS